MKSYLDLVPISAKVHKKQNRLTLISITLAVFLVTAIFSMADVWSASETQALISRHGNYHIILENISESDAALIEFRPDVAVSAWMRPVNDEYGKGYEINGRKTVLYGADPSYIYEIRNFPAEGAYPQNDREVMLSMKAKELFGLGIGSGITLNTPSGAFDYTVTGFCEDDEELNGMIDGVCTYMDRSGANAVIAANHEERSPKYYVQFDKKARVRQAIADIKEQYQLTDENVRENTAILGLSGDSTNQNMNGLYQLAAVLFLFILIAGVLMISSCMNSDIAQRTQFFGMLRCIGASKRQIIRFVRREALNWCRTAIPAGCLLGVALSWLLCVVLKNLVGGEFTDFSFKVSSVGIVCGVVVGIVTVLIASHSPAKRASRVSPVAAVSGNAVEAKKISHAANTRLFKVETALGVNHASASKKNLVLMTLSFAFMIILFFGFFAGIDFARSLIPSLRSFTPDVAIVSKDEKNTIDRSLKEELAEIPGVETVFANAFALKTPAKINGVDGSIDLISYDEHLLEWAQSSVISGDLSKVYGDSHYALTVFNKDSRLNVGDKLKIGDDELEIACVVSEGVWGDARATVYCSEETFIRLTGEENYVLMNAKLTKDADEETLNAIRRLAGEHEFTDRRTENQSTNSSYWVFRIGAYGFLGVIALITIFNIMNSISMSVTTKIKQYGTMRAVGMSVKQLKRMVAAETGTYAVCGLLVGCICGLYLHRLLYARLIIANFGGTWHIPVQPLVTVFVIVLLSCIAAVHGPSKRIGELSVTDTIHAQ